MRFLLIMKKVIQCSKQLKESASSQNRSNYTLFYFTLQIVNNSINFLGEPEDISIKGENREIPYDLIDLTSSVIVSLDFGSQFI